MNKRLMTTIYFNDKEYQVIVPYTASDGIRYISAKHLDLIKLMISKLGENHRFARYGDYTLLVHSEKMMSFNAPYRDFI